MERDTYKFRAKARIIAFVDLILSSMTLCLCLILFIGLLSITQRVNSNPNPDESNKSYGEGVIDATSGAGASAGNTMQEYDGMKQFHIRDALTVPNKAFVNLMWVFLALVTILTGVQILAAVRLLNATQLGKDPIGAMKLCRFWRRVCIFFTGLMIFNFLSSFRQRGDNFFETTFILTNILIRIVALYIVQQFVNELVSKLTGSLPIHHQPHIPADMTGVNMAYPYAPTYPMPMPSQSHGAPPKYEDVVKEPFNSNPA